MARKSGRLSLRMDSAVHARVAKTAKALGMDINGLLNLIIREHLLFYEELAVCTTGASTQALFARWREFNPKMNPHEFYWDLYTIRRLKDPAVFENNKYYVLDDTGDDFVEVPPPERPKQRSTDADQPKK